MSSERPERVDYKAEEGMEVQKADVPFSQQKWENADLAKELSGNGGRIV